MSILPSQPEAHYWGTKDAFLLTPIEAQQRSAFRSVILNCVMQDPFRSAAVKVRPAWWTDRMARHASVRSQMSLKQAHLLTAALPGLPHPLTFPSPPPHSFWKQRHLGHLIVVVVFQFQPTEVPYFMVYMLSHCISYLHISFSKKLGFL